MSLVEAFSNILHKKNIRIANLDQIHGALKELNRKRTTTFPVTGTALNFFVAPYSGFVEQFLMVAGQSTTSTSGNSVTVQILDVTQSNKVLATFDTYANLTELVADQAVGYAFAPALSGGQAITQFNAGDLLAIKVTSNGSSGFSGDMKAVSVAVTPNDKHYTI